VHLPRLPVLLVAPYVPQCVYVAVLQRVGRFVSCGRVQVHPNALEFSIPPRARFDVQQTHFKLQLAKAVSDYIAACDVRDAGITLPSIPLSEDDAAEFASCSMGVRQPSVLKLYQLSQARGADACIALDAVCDWTRLYHEAGCPGSDGSANDALCAAWTSVLLDGACVCVDSGDSSASGGWAGPSAQCATTRDRGGDHDTSTPDRVRKLILCLFQDHLIRVLLWGDHPLSVLVQKLCASFQSLYGPLSVHRYCLSPQEALELGKDDLQTALAHAQVGQTVVFHRVRVGARPSCIRLPLLLCFGARKW
jgi:hypothetical protein